MSKQYVITEKKDHSSWWIILVAAFLVAYGEAIMIGALIAGVCYLGFQIWKWYQSRRQAKQVEEQDAWIDAPTKLITEGMYVWGNPEHYINDYNDGMREWA